MPFFFDILCLFILIWFSRIDENWIWHLIHWQKHDQIRGKLWVARFFLLFDQYEMKHNEMETVNKCYVFSCHIDWIPLQSKKTVKKLTFNITWKALRAKTVNNIFKYILLIYVCRHDEKNICIKLNKKYYLLYVFWKRNSTNDKLKNILYHFVWWRVIHYEVKSEIEKYKHNSAMCIQRAKYSHTDWDLNDWENKWTWKNHFMIYSKKLSIKNSINESVHSTLLQCRWSASSNFH